MTIPSREFARRNSIVAHRGASLEEPENTIPALEAAAGAGADAVEVDVRVTSDGIPVLMHDPDVSVTTDGTGRVDSMTISEVKALDASGGGSTRIEVPTLAEALGVLEGLGMAVDLEIKNIPGEAAFDSPVEEILVATLEALEGAAFTRPVLISSFNWLTLERCRELEPGVPTGFLTAAPIDAAAALDYARRAGHLFVLPQAPALLEAGEALVREAHTEGVLVGTWTVDDEDVLARLFGWDVDAVASNDPSLAAAVRGRVLAQ